MQIVTEAQVIRPLRIENLIDRQAQVLARRLRLTTPLAVVIAELALASKRRA